MLELPKDLPAEIRRSNGQPEPGGAIAVASGPLLILAHGLMAIDPADRAGFCIRSALGDLSAEDAIAALEHADPGRAG